MAISNKVKGAAAYAGKDQAGLAAAMNLGNAQALSNKLYRGSFSAADLIHIAEYVGASLAFCFPDGSRIVMDESDLKEQ